MAVAHAQVLLDLGHEIVVAGRREESARRFTEETGVEALTGGVDAVLDRLDEVPPVAVVATPVPTLAATTTAVIQAGVTDVLAEKPAGLDRDEIAEVAEVAARHNARVTVAYNRRWYASTRKARELIRDDGSVTSFTFDFTELAWRVEEAATPEVKANWLLANSTHVIDLALFLGGEPTDLVAGTAGGLDWHPAARFGGVGTTDGGALFSYHADWTGPGRWGVAVVTPQRRLVLRPLEELRQQVARSFDVESVALDDDLDRRFKPGLHRQMRAFLDGDDDLIDIHTHLRRVDDVYLPMLRGNR